MRASVSPAAAQAQIPRMAGTRGGADCLKADVLRFACRRPAGLEGLPRSSREAVEQHLEFARKLHIETRVLEGDNAAETLVDFARRNDVTQIFRGKPAS